jgi:DNA modification methylase
MQDAIVLQGDARKLSSHIPKNSIDVVFTSPPYFDALDYTAYYAKLIYDIHDVDRLSVKNSLVQNIRTYKQDMEVILKEIDLITKENAIIIFVVGDKKTNNGVISGADFFSKLDFRSPAYSVERTYTGSSSQVFDKLNGTQRKEQIVVWHKCDDGIGVSNA